MSRRRILFLFNKFPYPPIGGDKLKVYNIGRILVKYFSLDLICLDEGPAGMDEFSEEPFEKIFRFRYPSYRFKINAMIGLFSAKPLQTHYYHFNAVSEFIGQRLRDYNLIFCHLLRMAPYVVDKKAPKIIDMGDSIALTYKRFISYAHGTWKLLYRIDAGRLVPYEVEIAGKFDRTFLVNEKEKRLLVSSGAPENKIRVITNGVREDLFSMDIPDNEKNEIVFFGRLAAFHNEDAAIYFAKEVFPLIKEKRKEVRFVIIGADPTRKILGLKRIAGVEVCGYMEDPYPRISGAMACVFPMRVAAGVQNKILEAMALGKGVVTTPVAVEALDCKDGRHLLVANGRDDMIGKILMLMDNGELRRRIGDNARRFIFSRYRWSDYENKLLPEIERILEAGA